VLAPWPYVRVGCETHPITHWREHWREIAEEHDLDVGASEVEAMLAEAAEAVVGDEP